MIRDQCFPNFRVVLSPSALHAIPGYQAFQLASSNRVNLIIDMISSSKTSLKLSNGFLEQMYLYFLPCVMSQSRSLCIGTSLNRSCHLNLRHKDVARKAT